MSIIIKNFDDNDFEKIPISKFKYKLSTYKIPSQLLEPFMNYIKNNNDIYVLCPTYMYKNYVPDYQMVVSGSITIGENVTDAINREIGEELGLKLPNYTRLELIEILGNYYTYININQLSLVENPHIVNHMEDTNKKVHVIIYGSYNDMIRYYTHNIERLHDPKEHKHLKQVCIIPFDYIITQLHNPNNKSLGWRSNNSTNTKFSSLNKIKTKKQSSYSRNKSPNSWRK